MDRALDTAQKVSMVVEALKSGKLRLRREDEAWAAELLALQRGPTRLLDISQLSAEAIAKARSTALALRFMQQEVADERANSALSMHDAQCTLFLHYEELFAALTGTNSANVQSEQEIKDRMLARLGRQDSSVFDDINAAIGAIGEFYRGNAEPMFRAARLLGGVKVVSGGQRRFGPSALTATRVAGLYCDTQLIPDPVWPFLASDLNLNALHLQLAIVLFYILPLRPLVDARLPEPPLLVFPSFEEHLEDKDAITQAGIASLFVKVVAPACNAKINSIEELFEYAAKHEQSFLDEMTQAKLFVPPGMDPSKIVGASEAVDIYLRELKGVRDEKMLSEMSKLPRGVLVLNGILERLRPQYHLRENAEEMNAQPLLSQAVHWYYFERCSEAETRELVNEKVLSRESFDILRALQDDSLTWLANIPVEGLVEIRQRMEHAELREQLKKCTVQLTAAAPAELEAVVREVRHGLEVLIQRQQKAIKDIEAKYSPKQWASGAGTLLGAVAGASMFFMPSLAAAAGVTAPLATVLGAIGGGGLTAAKEAVGQFTEKRGARKTMLGMLAVARAGHK